MNTSPQAGKKKEKKRIGIETEVGVQTPILAGTMGDQKGVVIEVEAVVEINPVGVKGPGIPGMGCPPIPVSTGITDAAACSAAWQNWK